MSILFASILVGLLCGSVNGYSANGKMSLKHADATVGSTLAALSAPVSLLSKCQEDNAWLKNADVIRVVVSLFVFPGTDYALYFPNRGVSNYANIWGMHSLTQFTVCFWMKSSATNSGTPFSYAVPGQDNELIIYKYKDFHLYIGSVYRSVHSSANDGRWHHICMSWQSSDGAGKFYKDGILRWHSTGLNTGHTIRGGGSLVLGQEQDSLQGGFDSNQSFQGYLTNVNVWSNVLSANTIKSLSKSCLSGDGNVYKWSDFRDGVKGKTAVVIPSPCYPPSTRG